MKVIGITGGVGSGKSALLAAIKTEYDCEILLADQIAHFLKEPEQSCYGPIVQLLGEDVLDERGWIDRNKMAEKIFADRLLLERVNAIVHPAVKQYIQEVITQEKKKQKLDFLFVEAALFLEAGYQDMADQVWYIYAKKQVREQRLQQGRGYSLEKIHSIMEKQLSEDVFYQKCDVVIDNSGSLEESMQQVRKELKSI